MSLGVIPAGVAVASLTGFAVSVGGDCWQEMANKASAKTKGNAYEDCFIELFLLLLIFGPPAVRVSGRTFVGPP